MRKPFMLFIACIAALIISCSDTSRQAALEPENDPLSVAVSSRAMPSEDFLVLQFEYTLFLIDVNDQQLTKRLSCTLFELQHCLTTSELDLLAIDGILELSESDFSFASVLSLCPAQMDFELSEVEVIGIVSSTFSECMTQCCGGSTGSTTVMCPWGLYKGCFDRCGGDHGTKSGAINPELAQ